MYTVKTFKLISTTTVMNRVYNAVAVFWIYQKKSSCVQTPVMVDDTDYEMHVTYM